VATDVLTFYVTEPRVPLITEFTPVPDSVNPSIVIEGTSFGDSFPVADLNVGTTTPYLEIFDCLESSGCEPNTTNAPKWTSGYSPAGDQCQVTVQAWSNTAIVLQFDSNAFCPFDSNQILGVLVWDTNSNNPVPTPAYTLVASSNVWGYCLNGGAGVVYNLISWSGWACFAESGPGDVAMLWSSAISPAPDPNTLAGALTDLSGVISCTEACFEGGVFGFGSNATSTSQFSSSITFQTLTVGEGTSIEEGSPFSLGAAFTLFTAGSTWGLLGGLSAGGCAGCAEVPYSFGAGTLTWNVDPLSGSLAATVNQGLTDMQAGTIAACTGGLVSSIGSGTRNAIQATLGACSAAFTPYAGDFVSALMNLYQTLQ
jgi:hypothetical protein